MMRHVRGAFVNEEEIGNQPKDCEPVMKKKPKQEKEAPAPPTEKPPTDDSTTPDKEPVQFQTACR